MSWQLRTSMLWTPRFSLRFAGSGKIEDMRTFMQTLYVYWYNKGFWGATVASAVDFLNTFGLLIVALIFTVRFDWAWALRCADSECAAHRLASGWHRPYILHDTLWGRIWGIVFLSATFVSSVYEFMRFVETYYLQYEIEEVAREAGVDTGFLTPFHHARYQWVRGLDGRDGHETIALRGGTTIAISTAGWGEFLETVCASVGHSGSVKFGAPNESLDPLRALQALMQLENYLIAIRECDALKGTALRFVGTPVLTALLASMFDAFRTVESRHKCIWAVRTTLVLYALLYVVGYVFFCLYSVLKAFVKNAAQVKVNYWAMSQRAWTTAAEWRFRLYNEVDHLHASRLRGGAEVADRMVNRLRVSNSMSRLVRRACSTCVFVTAMLSFLNPSLLIGGSIAGLTLVWWLTLALMLYSCVPEVDPREREYAYAADLEKLIDEVHYCAREWYESADAFYEHITTHFFRNRLQVVLTNLAQSFALPGLLLYALYDGSVEKLVEFMLQHSTTVDGVGSIAVGSDWGSDANASGCRHGNGQELSGADEGPSSTHSEEVASTMTLLGAPGAATGTALNRVEKVQQSIASFAAVYPQWTLKHLDGPTMDTSVMATTTQATLQSFLRELNRRVCTATAAERHASRDTSAAEDLAASRGSVVPPFSAQTQGQQTPRSGSGAERGAYFGMSFGGTLGGGDGMSFAAANTTAHDRERLFVSQVSSTRYNLHTSMANSHRSPHRRSASDYGTGRNATPRDE